MQRLADQLIGDVGAVVLRGIDVVDAEFDGAPQHRHRLLVIVRRPEHTGAGQLHGAEADAVDGKVAEGKVVRSHVSSNPAVLRIHPARQRGSGP